MISGDVYVKSCGLWVVARIIEAFPDGSIKARVSRRETAVFSSRDWRQVIPRIEPEES